MRQERNARARDRFNLRHVTRAAFEFHRLGANIDKLLCRRQCLLRRVVTVNRHIGHEQCALGSARDGPGVMQHFFERHTRRVFVTEHHHA